MNETCHHAWGEWVPTEDSTVWVRHCVICTARQRKEVLQQSVWRDDNEVVPFPENPFK